MISFLDGSQLADPATGSNANPLQQHKDVFLGSCGDQVPFAASELDPTHVLSLGASGSLPGDILVNTPTQGFAPAMGFSTAAAAAEGTFCGSAFPFCGPSPTPAHPGLPFNPSGLIHQPVGCGPGVPCFPSALAQQSMGSIDVAGAPLPTPFGHVGLVGMSGLEGGVLEDEGRAGKRSKSHRKDPQQHAASKMSQQRYRERKKAKAAEMEQTIAELRGRLALLQQLQRRNFSMEMNNSTLEAKLVEREREVEQLKFLVDRKMQSGGGGKASQQAAGDPSNDLAQAVATPGSVAPAVAAPFAPAPSSCSSGSCAAPTAAGVASCQAATATGGGCGGDCLVCCSPLLKDVADIDFDAEFEERVGALARLVDDHGLRETDPSGEGVPPRVMRRVADLVGRCCQLAQAAVGAEGAKALALFQGGRQWVGLGAAEVQGGQLQRWEGILEALRLTPPQQARLVQLRRQQVLTLRGIYQERQDLNLEAMARMLPRKGGAAQKEPTVEGRILGLAAEGHLPTAQASHEMCGVLDCIKETLRREQQAVMDLNQHVMSKVLTPIQAALFTVLSRPSVVDVLALMTALALKLGCPAVPAAARCAGGAGARARTCASSAIQGAGGNSTACCRAQRGEACCGRGGCAGAEGEVQEEGEGDSGPECRGGIPCGGCKHGGAASGGTRE